MKICTITCQNTVNHGARLQCYALAHWLQKQGHEVEVIDCLHKPFDPNTMEAVLVEEAPGIEPNMVIDVLQKGYTYKGKVIRHAMVKVSK